jgi:hypothetical protein
MGALTGAATEVATAAVACTVHAVHHPSHLVLLRPGHFSLYLFDSASVE